MKLLEVDLGDRSYPIFIGESLLADHLCLKKYCMGQVLIVTNTTLVSMYADQLKLELQNLGSSKVDMVVLPDGEQYKNLDTLNLIFDELLSKKYNRSATLIALGGGVVGDMTGFAAACYQRGVKFLQIPTTLLAQVDSSVGGKTGVNHALGKNMIGAFYQPQCVIIDVSVLNTLPQRELSAGIAEVIKYGLIYDATFFAWLEENMNFLLARDVDALAEAIEKSCQIKAEVVACDEKEAGLRAILNLGHTFGHAIEAHQGYGNWLHGEAVGLGMVMACDMSVRLGWLDPDILARARSLISRAGLPLDAPTDMSVDDYLGFMAVDKKVLDKKLRLILLKGLGQAVVSSDFEADVLRDTLTSYCV